MFGRLVFFVLAFRSIFLFVIQTGTTYFSSEKNKYLQELSQQIEIVMQLPVQSLSLSATQTCSFSWNTT